MTRKSPPPIFLQRASYRQRRLRDAMRLLPFLGIILWSIPLAWSRTDGSDPVGTTGLIYVFGVWVFLIVLTGVLSSRIKTDSPGEESADNSGDPLQ